jgi:hypothetical protein
MAVAVEVATVAKACGTIQEPMTDRDREYAVLLILWGRSLDHEIKTWEQWLEEREGNV